MTRVYGTLHGKPVYYHDEGYNQSIWYHSDDKKTKTDRKVEYLIGIDALNEEFVGRTFEEKSNAAWRMAYAIVPTYKVNPNDIRDIVTNGYSNGNEALAKALRKNP